MDEPAVTTTESPDDPSSTQHGARRAAAGRAAGWALPRAKRLLLCLVAATVIGSPLAVAWAITHTEVDGMIGTTPTTFTLSTQGHSEVRLGIAGTVYLPQAQGPIGVIATVDGPGESGSSGGDLAGYVRPEMLELYTGLFHDPGAAVDEYVSLVEQELRDQLVASVFWVGLAGGLGLFVLIELLPARMVRERRRDAVRVGASAALALAMVAGLAWVQLQASAGSRGPTEGPYALSALDGTLAAGATTDSPVVRALLGGAINRARSLVDRQEADERAYRETASQGLDDQSEAMDGPGEGEVSVMMQSDMHCNTTMIRLQRQVFSMLVDDDQAPALLAIAGDLTTNGTAAEGTCIRNERDIAGDRPVAAIGGNHETDISEQQMADAGMTVLDGEIEDVDGVRLLGDLDPSRSELFGPVGLRGDETQVGQGERIREVADDADEGDRPDVVMLHEAYATQAFLGIESVRDLVDGPETSLTQRPLDAADDGVDDVPAGSVFYGHWHRPVEPRVLWNSDGTWTFLMELNTTGGAVDRPSLTNFSTPWSRPQQEASFPVVFLDEETRMVTGYQLYRFATDGTVTVEPRVDVGDLDGLADYQETQDSAGSGSSGG
ncbi:metallophosphoesterase [Nocardioides sp. C4-1]|uniref:metallophosphoesterase family protein n=1 Tax=Nocardioides sp. C4-1 TaxID=3151851 RepID=UPI003263F4BD